MTHHGEPPKGTTTQVAAYPHAERQKEPRVRKTQHPRRRRDKSPSIGTDLPVLEWSSRVVADSERVVAGVRNLIFVERGDRHIFAVHDEEERDHLVLGPVASCAFIRSHHMSQAAATEPSIMSVALGLGPDAGGVPGAAAACGIANTGGVSISIAVTGGGGGSCACVGTAPCVHTCAKANVDGPGVAHGW